MRQAERKFITSTHIPDLDNANVGTNMITFFIESLITGDTLVSPFLCESRYKRMRLSESS